MTDTTVPSSNPNVGQSSAEGDVGGGRLPLRPEAAGEFQFAIPSLMRRLACMLYEGVVLFGVVMVTGLVFAGITQQRNAMVHHHALQAVLFIVLGIYFTWFWSHSGQTVAMKAWHIRVLDRQGRPLTLARAFVRYLASWMWFMPALAALAVDGTRNVYAIFGTLALGVLCYAAVARFAPSRQFWHDVICGTQLVTQRPRRRVREDD